MDADAKPYTEKRWTPPEQPPVSRFDDVPTSKHLEKGHGHGDLHRITSRPLLVWFGDRPPEPPPMLVQDLLPQGQIAIAAGVFSSGKTFVVGDLAACIMLDLPFAGHEIVRPGGVLWMAAEGANEIDARIMAAAEVRAGGEVHALPFARQAFDVPKLTGPDAEAELLAHADAFKVGLAERFPGVDLVIIVIDTLGSAAGFIDGNSSSEAQRVMDLLRRVNVATGALILLVDHFGKAVETGVMGASAKAQSADAVLGILADKSLEGEISNRRMAVAKLRGGAGGAVTPFRLRQVRVGEAGGTTCVVDWDLAGEAAQAPMQKPTKNGWSGKGRLLKAAIECATIEHGQLRRPFGGEGPEVKAVERERVRAEFYASYAAEDMATKRKAFGRLLDQALAARLIAAREIGTTDWLWLVTEEAESCARP